MSMKSYTDNVTQEDLNSYFNFTEKDEGGEKI